MPLQHRHRPQEARRHLERQAAIFYLERDRDVSLDGHRADGDRPAAVAQNDHRHGKLVRGDRLFDRQPHRFHTGRAVTRYDDYVLGEGASALHVG